MALREKIERAARRVMRGGDWQPLQLDQLVRQRNGGLEHRLKIRCGDRTAKVDLTEAEVRELHEMLALATPKCALSS